MRVLPSAIRILNVSETAHGGLGTYFEAISSYGSPAVAHSFLLPESHAHMTDETLDRRMFRHRGRNPATVAVMLREFRRAVRAVRPDVIMFHSFFSIPALLFARLAYPSIPRVYIAHGWTIRHFRRGSLAARVAAVCEGMAGRAANCCVSVSPSELEFARIAGIPGRHEVVALGVAPGDATGRGPEEAREPGAIRLLFVGRFDRQKGLDLLLRAYTRARAVNPDLCLRIIGEAARARDPAGGLDFSDLPGVEVLGWLRRGELDVHYAWADALVAPSRWEAGNFVVREAARHGTPAIVSDRDALPDLVRDGVDGFVFHLSGDEDIGPLTQLLSGLSADGLSRMREAVWAGMGQARTTADMVAELEHLLASLSVSGMAAPAS